jgi:hypothetical protein
MIPGDTDQTPEATFADISITAHGNRRILETVFLELRELAQRNGLKLEYRLTLTEPEDQTNS